MKSQKIFKLGKAAFTLLLLAIVLRRADLGNIIHIVKESDLDFILLAILSFTFYQLMFAYNWNKALATLKANIQYADLLKIHMTGLFYNLFLPTSMGGELAKIYYLSKRLNNRITSLKSVALVRGVGLLTNLLILTFSLAFNRELFMVVGYDKTIIHGFYFVTGTIAVLSIINRVACGKNKAMKTIVKTMKEYILRLKSFLEEFKLEMVMVVLISLVNQLIIILENFLILESLHMNVGFIGLMYIIPLTFFATLLPITIAGIGIREGAFIYFLTRYGYTVDSVVAFSLIGYLIIMIMGITGGIVNAMTSEE